MNKNKHYELEFYKPKGRWFEISAVEHCNLNCASYTHFSPIAQPKYICLNQLESDLKALNNLVGDHLYGIKILGGEPLLHPNLASVIGVVRNYFPQKQLMLFTNALLLAGMDTYFFDACKAAHVSIVVTKYPINKSMFKNWTEKLLALNVQYVLSNSRGCAYKIYAVVPKPAV